MKRILATLLLTLSCAFAYSATLDSTTARDAGFDELSEPEKAELIKNIAERKAAKREQGFGQTSTPQKVNEWLDIGSRIGQGMAGAAKEMGVAVNEFAKTPVGIWTIVLITWKFMGATLLHIVGGVLIWMIGFSFIWWVSRFRQSVTTKYDNEKTDIFGRSRLVSVQRGGSSEDHYVGLIVMAFIVLIAGIISMFSY